jgi:hypothetical protein
MLPFPQLHGAPGVVKTPKCRKLTIVPLQCLAIGHRARSRDTTKLASFFFFGFKLEHLRRGCLGMFFQSNPFQTASNGKAQLAIPSGPHCHHRRQSNHLSAQDSTSNRKGLQHLGWKSAGDNSCALADKENYWVLAPHLLAQVNKHVAPLPLCKPCKELTSCKYCRYDAKMYSLA